MLPMTGAVLVEPGKVVGTIEWFGHKLNLKALEVHSSPNVEFCEGDRCPSRHPENYCTAPLGADITYVAVCYGIADVDLLTEPIDFAITKHEDGLVFKGKGFFEAVEYDWCMAEPTTTIRIEVTGAPWQFTWQ